VAYILIKIAMGLLSAAAAVIISVVASVHGFTGPLVAAAIAALIVLRIRQHSRGRRRPYQAWRLYLITGLILAGFFLVLSIAGAIRSR